MSSYIDLAINRSRSTLMLMGVLVLAGLISRSILPIANDPHIVLPYFYIGIAHEGISPEDSERLLIQPMEIELRKIEGLKEISATASEGFATIFVEFEPSIDLNVALVDVREAVDRGKSEIPTTAEEPIVRELDVDDFPLIQINLLSQGASERQIYETALKLRDDIESIPSVLSAEIRGDREEVLEVIIDPQALEAYQISSESLVSILQRNNRLIPAGSIDTGRGRFSVKVPSIVESASDIMDLPVQVSGDSVVTLSDVASIRRTFKDRTSHARFNGVETMTVEVKKRVDANVIDTADAVLKVVKESTEGLPSTILVVPSQNTAEFAQVQVTELQGNIMTALALVMVIVVAAMGFRSGVIVGLGIPFSLLFSIIIIYQLGYTFNFMVMFGMLLGLGMLIDGAIVVTEYADRKMSEGMDHRDAYSEAVKRMFWPVTASTATTLAAFLPLIFWPGISGQFMRYLPVTVFTVLTGSLIYALLFGPVLGSIFGKPTVHSAAAKETMEELDHGDPTQLQTVTGAYARMMTWITRHPLTTVGTIFTLLFCVFWSYGKFGAGMVFFNDSDPQFISISVSGRGNFSEGEVNDLVLEVERQVLQVPDIRSVNTRTILPGGNSGGGGMGGGAVSDRIGSIFLELVPEWDRDRDGFAVVRELRERTGDFAGIKVEVIAMEQGPSVGKPVQLELRSRHRELLEPAMLRIRQHMDSLPELIDIDDTRALPSIEWRMQVDRAQAALFAADVQAAGVALQLVTTGVKVAEYRPDGADDAVDIRARFPIQDRGILAMDDLRISTRQGQIPLSNFVRILPAPGVDTFKRIDTFPVERLRANVVQGVLADTMVGQIQEWLETQTFDPRISIEFRGANEEQTDAMAFVKGAFLLSLLLMFVLLVTQFNSFYQSALILLAVIMSTAGVLLGLMITGNPFSAVLTGVGIVALAGIVVNNNIVLIDTFNVVRSENPELGVQDAIVRAAAQRLRPVMLTTVTTVFGLLPLACDLSIDIVNRSITAGGQMATFWGPLSQAIVFGLSFATILTLIATPALLALPSDLRHRWAARRTRQDAALNKSKAATA
ncbi:efflux RND transporter permease subunit [Congregibacter sp.]|jgi:multidrug efflux pump|uniref:efflux RND transporter permease subunit n=1 Tax=Congregibacter sp. TaxID=2744308 RepID=UPI0039E577A0